MLCEHSRSERRRREDFTDSRSEDVPIPLCSPQTKSRTFRLFLIGSPKRARPHEGATTAQALVDCAVEREEGRPADQRWKNALLAEPGAASPLGTSSIWMPSMRYE